ncbi:MAG: MBL fold metallo-hydrolase [Lachnospiraceae bacterium]|jgi:glyoxylase-like metal-dependent hydrolase (beta-lactamase superfamily II)|nr:MBL fold metallo-hydrolase [Lachnospiraceae bacterium]
MITYEIEQPYPWLYRIKDPLDVYFSLIVGDEKALLFDTGHGVGDIKKTIRTITDKPVTVVLGHCHVDHVNGAYQFGEAYLCESEFPICRLHTKAWLREKMILNELENRGLVLGFEKEAWCSGGEINLKALTAGTVFALGNLHAEVVDMKGHTAGTVGLLIKEKRVLLESDGANGHCWMFLEESLSIREYIATLERVLAMEFDTFFTSHTTEAHPKAQMERFLRVAKNITMEKSTPYDVSIELFKTLSPYIYTETFVSAETNTSNEINASAENSVSVVFSERTLSG